MPLKFSIVTPSFRQLEWLRLAMRSVADQEGVNVEHIVQDAGSDGIREMFEESVRSSNHPQHRARLFVEKDNGMYDAINRGLRRSSGDILAHLNCDEQYLPGTLKRVEDFFLQYPDVDVLFGNVVVIDQAGRYMCSREVLLPRLYHTWVCTNPVFTAATFFRRRVISAEGLYFDDSWRDVGDSVWLLELLKRRIRMACLGVFTTAFADTGENLMLKPNAFAEQKRFFASAPAWMRVLRPFWMVHYRVRRLLAGHYFPGPFKFAVYLPEGGGKRQTIEVKTPTGIWRNRLQR